MSVEACLHRQAFLLYTNITLVILIIILYIINQSAIFSVFLLLIKPSTMSPAHIISILLSVSFKPYKHFLLTLSLLIFLINTGNKATAQDFFPEQTNYGISYGMDYDMPLKNLTGYNAGIRYHIGFLKYLNNITAGIMFAYRQYNPKQANWGEQIEWDNYALYSVSPYRSYALFLSVVYNKPLNEKTVIYGGLNLGSYRSYSSMRYQDDFAYSYQEFNQSQMYVAPKLGATFALNNYWDIDVHAAYNIFTQGGSIAVNSRTGSTSNGSPMYTSLTTGLGIVVKF